MTERDGDSGLLRVWRGGHEVDPPVLSPRDRGVTLGFGVFETVRLYGGVPFRLDRHLSRLRDGAEALEIPLPPALERWIRESVQRVGELDARLRITLTGGREDGAGGADAPALVVDVSPWAPDPGWYEEGITAGEISAPQATSRLTAGAKTTSRADTVLAMKEAREAGFHEGLWRDEEGNWVEGTASNLFVVRDGVVRTPPLRSGCLAGVTREAVLEVAEAGGVRVEGDRLLEPAVFEGADEAFISSSLRELLPVVAVNGAAVGSGEPGVVWRRLWEGYRELVSAEVGRG